MARKPSPPRIIPNWQMEKPWTEPISPQEEEAIASSVVISVPTAISDRTITAYMQEFAGDSAAYAQALGQA